MAFPLNLTLTCYYFETLSRDVNSPRRCDVNKDGEGVTSLVNLTLTCYCHVMYTALSDVM